MFYWQAKLIDNVKKDLCLKFSLQNYSNLRYPFEKALEKVKTKKKLKILFYVNDRAKWCSDSLFKELQKHACFEANIALQHIDDAETDTKNINFFKNIDENLIEFHYKNEEACNLLTFEPDLVFYQQPWYHTEENSIEKVSKSCLTAYVPYGFMLNESVGTQYYLPFHFCLWRYFAENEEQKKLLNEKNNFLSDRVLNLGYPKLDGYFSKNIQLQKPNKKTVIYAPHWSIKNPNLDYSTFEKNYKYLLKKATNTPDINWIYKPHPVLIYQLEKTGFMSTKDYLAYENEWAKLPNAKVVTDGNYFDTFEESNLLITDSISFLAEYLPTGNPIIHLKNKNCCGFNKIAKKLIKNYYKAYDIKQIDRLIDQLIAQDNDCDYKKRMKALKYVMDNKTPAGENIVKYLIKTFELSE